MMKKTITLLFAGLVTLGLSAQNFGVGLDYMMLSGTMVKDADGNAVTYIPEGATATEEVSGSSIVLNVHYAYTINEEIKIVTTLRKGRYTVPTKPNKWKQAQDTANFLVEQSIDKEMLDKITEKYIKSGGQYRELTTEEGYARGLIITVIFSFSYFFLKFSIFFKSSDLSFMELD